MNFYYSQKAFLDEIQYLTKNCGPNLEKIERTLKFYKFKCKLDKSKHSLKITKFGRTTVIEGLNK